MDPAMYLQYSPPNGLPQESKLATYMNRSPSTPNRTIEQGISNLTLDSTPNAVKKTLSIHHHPPPQPIATTRHPPPQIITHIPPPVLIGEYLPINYFSPPGILSEPSDNSPPVTLTPVGGTIHQENVGGTTYFYSTNTDSHNPPGAPGGMVGPEPCLPAVASSSSFAPQMYAAPPYMPTVQAKPGLAQTFYMPETIKEDIYHRNDNVFMQPDMRQYPDIPEVLDMYTELMPLEGSGHSMATAFRASHRHSGELFALRRLHSCALPPPARLDAWRHLDHPNIVRLHRAFPTRAFGDHSLVLVYDYHPACVTLMNKYLSGGPPGSGPDPNGAFHDPFSADPDAPRPYTHQKNAMLRAVACGALLPEAVLWSMLVQLTAALRAVHAAGLACRSLDPTKVVMNGCRIRIAWCGIGDLQNNTMDVAQAQQDDLTALGRLALALACRTVQVDNLAACMDLVARSYSSDLKNLILYLLAGTTRRSVVDIMPMIGARFYTQVEALERRTDALEEHLAREADNGRLLRMLMKLGAVNERPELNMDTAWAETGDRYMLKLFRDHLFHSVTPDGRPWLDQAHLAYALNNLDGGTQARVMLMSRDEQSILVVSYAELKHCLDQAFDEVMQAASSPQP
ncbi:PAN2-PAN3 deadenylation complex subunit PAN3 isoform X4 [Maniola jurtina]|uniref:PAN2-PAN3 deadenylation complex subunit PAN3 isoform X4 n=1 Tax=Maniola jurtina TaxID=191418 RepID=UPI001E68C4CB|nr:PAN2-PAN3 deadenylation complex subunit PAN3 isoform X4 [Maniola jurtina]